jgi:hypothetical protein
MSIVAGLVNCATFRWECSSCIPMWLYIWETVRLITKICIASNNGREIGNTLLYPHYAWPTENFFSACCKEPTQPTR